MIIQQLLRQLDHPDPAQRIAAIKQIAQSKDPDALKPLATVYKTDSDPEVRDMALKAGRYIQKHNGTGGSDGASAALLAAPEKSKRQPEAASAPRGAAITPQQEERAKQNVSAAMDYHLRDENEKAIKQLQKAFALNPALKTDPYTISLASTITGLTGQSAIAAIVGGDMGVNQGGGIEKLKKGKVDQTQQDSDWFGAGLWTAILSFTITVGPLVTLALILWLFTTLLGFMFGADIPQEEFQAGIGEFIVQSIPQFIPLTLLSITGIIAQILVTHFAARLVFKGTGKLPTLMMRVTRFLTILLLASLAAIIVTIVMTPFWPTVLTAYTAGAAFLLILSVYYPFILIFIIRLAAGLAAMMGSSSGFDSGASTTTGDAITLMLAFVLFLLQAAWVAKQTTDTHRIDIARGVGAVTIGYVAMIPIAFLLSLFLEGLLTDLLNMFGMMTSGGAMF